jgi:acetyl-CoA synthetase
MPDQTNIESTLTETRVFEPSDAFREQAHIQGRESYRKLCAEADADPAGFWAGIASELHWHKPWDRVLEWEPPFAKWFSGGEINLSYNCLDRHLNGPRKNKAAIIWESEPGEVQTLTYQQLHDEVCRFANALKSIGVSTGERVAIYMGMCPALPIAMLACARIGAPHTVVFGGFSATALADRVNDCQASCVITQDGAIRRGAELKLKTVVDEALATCPSVRNVVVYQRTGSAQTMQPGRDHWWHELMAGASDECEAIPLDAEHPLFLLYTSGTTGKPKGILHTTGGYSVGAYISARWVFDLKDEDVYWCTADIGWITGHSYIVYGPLLNGAGPLLAHRGAPQGLHSLYRADGHPLVHAPGRRASAEIRNEVAAPARVSGRAHQPRSVDVVPRSDRAQPLSDCGYLVADRDGFHHGGATAGRDCNQAGLGDAAAAGHRGGRGG